MGSPLYKVIDWDRFENAGSRAVKSLSWFSFPNGAAVDAREVALRYLLARPDGLEMFGAFVMILRIASRMPERGVLADDNGPLDAMGLAVLITRADHPLEPHRHVITEKGPTARVRGTGRGRQRGRRSHRRQPQLGRRRLAVRIAEGLIPIDRETSAEHVPALLRK